MSQPETTPNGPPPQEEALPPTILTLKNCTLRNLHPLDAPAIHRACDSPVMAKYMSYRFSSPYTLEAAHQWIGYATTFTVPGTPDVRPLLGICDPVTNTVIGGIGVKAGVDIEEFCFEVGYWVAEAAWGKGIMTEACRGYCKWVFETYPKVNRLEAAVFEGNDASVKVLERCGFTHEGDQEEGGNEAR